MVPMKQDFCVGLTSTGCPGAASLPRGQRMSHASVIAPNHTGGEHGSPPQSQESLVTLVLAHHLAHPSCLACTVPSAATLPPTGPLGLHDASSVNSLLRLQMAQPSALSPQPSLTHTPPRAFIVSAPCSLAAS